MQIESDGEWSFMIPNKLGSGPVIGFCPVRYNDTRLLMIGIIPEYQGPTDFDKLRPLTFLEDHEADLFIRRIQAWREGRMIPNDDEIPVLQAELVVDQMRRKMFE